MKYFSTLLTLLSFSTLAITGCATTGKSIAAGGAFGAGTGALVGAIADPGAQGQYRTRNVFIGAALGGVAGIATGAIIGDGIEDKKKEAFDDGRKSAEASHVNDRPAGSPPDLKNAKVDARWVEGKVTGNRYVDGHWEYLITEPARWEDSSL